MIQKMAVDPRVLASLVLKDHPVIFVGGQYFVYEDGVYRKRPKDLILRFISEIIEEGSFSQHRLNEIETAVRLNAFRHPEKINADTDSINCKNLILSLKDFSTRSHSPDEFWTTQLGAEYDPEAKCPAFEKFMETSLEGRTGFINAVQEFFGYALTHDKKFWHALILHGITESGKGVTCDTLRYLLGPENCSNVTLEDLDRGFLRAHLFGKSANIATEITSRALVADGIFKALTSGDHVTAEFKNRDPFDFRFTGKLIFSCNDLPPCNDRTSAYYNRLLIIDYKKSFKDSPEKDSGLKWPNSKFKDELPGILNWAIQGLKRLNARGKFEITEEMTALIEKYQTENSSVRLFVDSQCDLNQQGAVPVGMLFDEYKKFCESSNYRPLSKINFGKELRDAFPTIIQDVSPDGKARQWEGLCLCS